MHSTAFGYLSFWYTMAHDHVTCLSEGYADAADIPKSLSCSWLAHRACTLAATSLTPLTCPTCISCSFVLADEAILHSRQAIAWFKYKRQHSPAVCSTQFNLALW